MRTYPDFTERVAAQLAPLAPPYSAILIGLSGGADSVVLLHLLHRLSPRFFWRLSALHVHHGISPNANSWADFCAQFCASHDISLHIEHVDIAPLREHGIEAAARKLRHAAFAGRACDFVALAHHADDQAETLLLQLLRGAGVRGASAMSAGIKTVLAGSAGTGRVGHIIRPLLHCTRQEILGYAAVHGLRWIEDESNADENYPRNFLRHRLLPLLEQKFPAYRSTLSRSVQHFAEGSELLDDLARLDGAQAILEDTLAVATLQALTRPRAKNLLRYFLHSMGAPMPQTVQLEDMLHQLCCARADALLCVAYGEWEVRRYLGRVHVLRALGEFDRSMVLHWLDESVLEWVALNASLVFTSVQGYGVSLTKLQRKPLTLRLRQGGETLRPHLKAAKRTLRNLLQEHLVPPWQRDRLPLLYCGDELVCVVGVAVAAEYQAVNGEAGVAVNLLHRGDD